MKNIRDIQTLRRPVRISTSRWHSSILCQSTVVPQIRTPTWRLTLALHCGRDGAGQNRSGFPILLDRFIGYANRIRWAVHHLGILAYGSLIEDPGSEIGPVVGR